MTEKTHWRKIIDTDFLSTADLEMAGRDSVVLTIKSAAYEKLKVAGKMQSHIIVRFEKAKKPMIIKATNAKAIQKVAKSGFLEEWAGTRVTVYIEKNVAAFGSVVDALRIRTVAPATPKPKTEK